MAEKMIKQSQTQVKQAPVATIRTMDQTNPVLPRCNEVEIQAGKLVERGIVESISHETVRLTLK